MNWIAWQIQMLDRIEALVKNILLRLSKTVIAKHHGKIHIESAPSEGSEFTITVPIRNA